MTTNLLSTVFFTFSSSFLQPANITGPELTLILLHAYMFDCEIVLN